VNHRIVSRVPRRIEQRLTERVWRGGAPAAASCRLILRGYRCAHDGKNGRRRENDSAEVDQCCGESH
jgi:hypothetical protein